VTASRPAIVLIDDEQPLLDFLSFMLRENLRCPVHAFTRPRAALTALADLAPAVVVTDYWMPEIDGFELIREASQVYPALPFIIITGHVIDPAAKRVRESTPLRAILPKPFGWRVLAEEILRHAPHLGPMPLEHAPHPLAD
jgi:DNA-binding NtrC family response regulator